MSSAITSVLLPSAYRLSLYSLPVLVVGIVIGVFGFVDLLREHASRVSTAFFGLTVCVAIWLVSFAVIYSTVDQGVALWWARRVEHLGVAFIPSAMFSFSLEITGRRRRAGGWVWLCMAVSFLFYLAFSGGGWLLPSMQRYWWGFYPRYTPLALCFIAYFSLLLAGSLALFVREYRQSHTNVQRRRMLLLVSAFAVAYLGSVDFVASYGVALYPAGFVPVLVFLIILAWVFVRYRLVDITPAYMSEQIMQAMPDGLLVLDHQGIVRLSNEHAAAMVGREARELTGVQIGQLPGFRAIDGRLSDIFASGGERIEIAFKNDGAAERFVSLSTSVIYDSTKTERQPVALVCVARDVSKRIHDEREIRRHAERLSALHTIDRAITGSMDLGLTLNVLLDQITTQLHVDAAAVLLYSEETNVLEFAAARGLPVDSGVGLSVPLGEGLAGQAAVEKRMMSTSMLAESDGSTLRLRRLVELGIRTYHALPLVAKGRLRGILEVFQRSECHPDEQWIEFLIALAEQAAIAVDNAVLFQELERTNIELRLAYDHTLEGWALALELRDVETEGHSRRVSAMTVKLAQSMGLSAAEITHVRRGALLHDLGKMGIPDSILFKEASLSDDEWFVMRQHTEIAYEMLRKIPFLRPALDIPYCHHEKWDGTGYPRGLKGEAIPFAARLFSVVDVWDALNSPRSYRDAWPEERVRSHIRGLSGSHFDPAVVDRFVELDWKI